jgi:hypothetical protein
MIERVDFEAETFGQPLGELRVVRLDVARHDATGARPSICSGDSDGPQEGLILRRLAHVVDRQNDDAFDPSPTHCGVMSWECPERKGSFSSR